MDRSRSRFRFRSRDEAGQALPDGSFDLIFIDADKANYPAYLEEALRLARTGGLILFDNVLWSGRVLEQQPDDPDTRAIQALNLALKNDRRVDLSMLPVGDGLTLCRKR